MVTFWKEAQPELPTGAMDFISEEVDSSMNLVISSFAELLIVVVDLGLGLGVGMKEWVGVRVRVRVSMDSRIFCILVVC